MRRTASRNCYQSLILLALLINANTALGQGSAFTYQGRVTDSGATPSGNYDFQLKLFDASSVQIGSTLTRPNVPVSAGIFTVQLDFGATSFPGADRFLEIGVKPAASPDPFLILSPRQQITSTPYAIRSSNATLAETAGNATQLGGVVASQYVVTTDSRLSDPRAPTPGSSNYIQNRTSQQASSDFNISGSGTAGENLSANIVNATTHYNIGGSRVVSITGFDNTFVGLGVGAGNTSGISNSFFGRSAGFTNSDGSFNSFFGVGAGFSNQTGQNNSSFGFQSGNNFTDGSDNAFFGYRAGLSSTGSRNTLVGANASVGGPALTNVAGLGANVRVDQSNSLVLGSIAGINGATASTSVGIGTTAPGTKLEIVTDGTLDPLRLRTTNATNPRSYRIGPGVGSPFIFGIFDDNAAVTRLAIDSSGNVGIGTTGPANKLHVLANGVAGVYGENTNGVRVGNQPGVYGQGNAEDGVWAISTNANGLYAQGGNFAAYLNGNVFVSGVVRTSLGSVGDTALCLNNLSQISSCFVVGGPQTNVQPFLGGFDIIKQLRPIGFTWQQGGTQDIGLDFEEVEKVEPLLASRNGRGQERVKYDQLSAVFINAFKEQQAQIQQQQELIKQQQGQIKQHQEQVVSLATQLEGIMRVICNDRPSADVCKMRR